MDDTSIILILTIGTTFLGLMLKFAFKSKCDSVNICFGCLTVHRAVDQELNDTIDNVDIPEKV